MTGLGFNVHMSYVTAGAWPGLLTRFEADKPGALLLLDSFGDLAGRALEAAGRLPETTVVYRKFLRGDNQQEYLTPEQWAGEHAAFVDTRVYCSVNNEPGFAASIDWHARVMDAAYAARIRASVGGYSVGVPEPEQIGLAAPLLRKMASRPGWYLLDLHEYAFNGLWTGDFAPDARAPSQWPADVPDGMALWLMGRFRHWLQFCDSAGIARPKIVIGEWGFDGGAYTGLHKCAPAWQTWGIGDWQVYAAAQLKAAWRAIYRRYPEITGVCFFSLSDTDSGWEAFNAWRAPGFLAATREGFDKMTTTTPAATPYAAGSYRMQTAQTHINIRAAPNGTDIGDIRNGDAVTVAAVETASAGGYTWQKVAASGVTGWIALMASYTLAPALSKEEFIRRMRALLDEYEGL